ncbi:MAG TPA: hypothetical protein VFK04_12800 [Gemmatimonadaceae bacterium]|nr:hypothetical protein [Gemmatimonadaceae bacterium]
MSAPAVAVRERPILFSGEMVRAILGGRKVQTRRVVNPQPPEWVSEFGYTCFTPPGHISGRGYWKGVPGEEGPAEKFFRCPYGQPGDRLWVREAWQADTGSCNPAFPDGPLWWHEVPRSLRTSRAFRYLYYRADNAIVSWDESLADLPWEDRRSAWVPTDKDPDFFARELRWRPSIHMPRWASRITLEITDVRVQRVQEISEEDARAEGATQRDAGWSMDWSRVGSLSRFAAASEVKGRDLAPLSERDIALPTARGAFGNTWEHLNAKRGYGWDVNPWVWALTFRRVA